MIAELEKAGVGFEYFIPPASTARAIAVGYAFLFLLIVFAVPLLANGSYWDPIFWVIVLGICPLVAFFLLLAFPPRAWRARLEVDRDVIRYFPVPPLRWIGEPATTLPVTEQTRELLVCRGSKDTYGGFFANDSREFPYGFRIIIRSTNEHDRQLTVKTGNRLSPRQAQSLVDGIASATGLSARLVKRKVRDDGTFPELPWIPDGRLVSSATFAKLAFATTPILGGVAVGLSQASGTTAALVGIFLWLAQTIVVLIVGRRSLQQSKLAFAYWLTTAFTFAASYTVVFLITASSLRAR